MRVCNLNLLSIGGFVICCEIAWKTVQFLLRFPYFLLLNFDCIYLTHTTDVFGVVVAPGNNLPLVYWKLELHAVTWWEKQ